MQAKDFEQEQKWLDQVYNEIDEQVARQEQKTSDYHGRLLDIRTSLREEHGLSSASPNKLMDVAQQITELRQSASEFGIQHRFLEQLQTAKKAPYFGRMDFHEKGFSHSEAMYIGIRSLMDHKKSTPLVYDWRAPVSSMFYDYGLGEAKYEGPAGVYRGVISLKRQYRLKERKLIYMFDNELKIDDEVLQQALGQHATDKMRTIVNTIQREQNQAIRNDQDELLLVEGPAGSGKTSVALHRVAYLLYKYRESIRSQNIVIFSPNRIFRDYISHVLPELGEENVRQLTFQDFVEPFLGWEWDVQTQLAYLEDLLQKADSIRDEYLRTMAFKSSPAFEEVLSSLVDLIINESCDFFDVRVRNELVISKTEQEKLFTENYSYLPAQKRLQKIRQRVMYLLRPVKRKYLKRVLQEVVREENFKDASWWSCAREAVTRVNQELAPTLREVNDGLHIDYLAWYMLLWQDSFLWKMVGGNLAFPEEKIRSLKCLEKGGIAYEDVVPLLYLKGELEGYPVQRSIQHVVVDEVQDYTPMQLQILIKTFPKAKFTFVGDVYQSLSPYVWQAEGTALEEVFASLGLKTVKLNKSYRSTEEIYNFCNGLLGGKSPAETVLRYGPKPLVHKVSQAQQIPRIHSLITAGLENAYETIAVICETVGECQRIYERLKQQHPQLGVSLLVQEKDKFKAGIVIVPVFLAKGLEFDAVILPDVSCKTFGQEYKRRLLYVASSRALHRLDLLYSGNVSPFIQALPEELYDLELDEESW